DNLIQMARIGDILAIQDEVMLLQETDSVFTPFTKQILVYARDFQIRRIREFLESQQQEVLMS
ncbi:MAG: hypothetical protein ACK45T_22210, partial [Pseudanabaena sp.]